ncbi:MAG: hypothetical protein K1000chlam4_00460 [Chlamydiae bacterium]|nr:hypothetical protein [Chlamydiota bacterium]
MRLDSDHFKGNRKIVVTIYHIYLKMVISMKRVYEKLVREHFEQNRQMLFLVGPRQVGKTTLSLFLGEESSDYFYFNWDNQDHRLTILEGAKAIAQKVGLDQLSTSPPIVIFDEIHKYRKWKDFLKGLFDTYPQRLRIIVTGSAQLDVFRTSSDSLMGRYFLYRMHPLSIAEITHPELTRQELNSKPSSINPKIFENLLKYGGFPEPILKSNTQFYNRWKRLRHQQLFYEDIRSLTRIQELAQIEILAELLRYQIGQLTSFSSLARKVNVSIDTIRRWLTTLQALYYCFSIRPWSKNISRSLIKEPKFYLWDWSLVENEGAKKENFVASHLLKAIHFWTDRGLGEYDLFFLRDKEKREVDFLITRNQKPWIIIEVKSSKNHSLSSSLFHFQAQLKAKHVFQLAFDMAHVDKNCFSETGPIIVPAQTFLSQLV